MKRIGIVPRLVVERSHTRIYIWQVVSLINLRDFNDIYTIVEWDYSVMIWELLFCFIHSVSGVQYIRSSSLHFVYLIIAYI